MASQRITVAKVGGAAGLAVLARFRAWAGARTFDDPLEWSPDQWPATARREMDDLAASLRSNGHTPPVVYFNEHVDLWSMGDVFDAQFPRDHGPQPIRLHADLFELWCYPLPDDGQLAGLLQRSLWRRRTRGLDPQETRWLAAHLLEAALAWSPMVEVASLVLLREVFGGLVEDHEIVESLSVVPGWIAGQSDPSTFKAAPGETRRGS